MDRFDFVMGLPPIKGLVANKLDPLPPLMTKNITIEDLRLWKAS